MSDDEGDVVVMRVCAGVGCTEMYGLEFDETTGESFCPDCLAKLREAEEQNDFRVLLSPDDQKAIAIIFKRFASGGKEFWTHEEFNDYLDITNENRSDPIGPFDSNDELAEYLREEYEIDCESIEVPASTIGLPEGMVTLSNVVTINVLEKIYGGYMYHGVNALRDDVEALEDAGEVNFDILE